jgi:hypothetical protein
MQDRPAAYPRLQQNRMHHVGWHPLLPFYIILPYACVPPLPIEPPGA